MAPETLALVFGALFGSTGLVTWVLNWFSGRRVQQAQNQLTLNAQNIDLTKTTVAAMAELNKSLVQQLADKDQIIAHQSRRIKELENS